MILGIDCSFSKLGKVRTLLEQAKPDKIIELTANNTAEVIEEIKKTDGLLIATPVHWFNVPWQLKKLIEEMDTVPDEWPFEDKALSIITVCNEDGGELAGLMIAAPLLHMGFMLPPFSIVFHNTSMTGGEDNWQNEEIKFLIPRMKEWFSPPPPTRD